MVQHCLQRSVQRSSALYAPQTGLPKYNDWKLWVMRTHSFAVRDADCARQIDAWLAMIAEPQGVVVTLRTSHRTRPGSTHWHVTSSRGSGTIEITHEPRSGRVTLVVRANRSGTWAGEAVSEIAQSLEQHVKRRSEPSGGR